MSEFKFQIPNKSGERVAGQLEYAEQQIEERIMATELGSVRFQAFTDYVDYVVAESQLEKTPYDNLKLMEYLLINETIRKRTNGVKGYQREYDEFMGLGQGLKNTLKSYKMIGQEVGDFSTTLLRMKNAALDEKST